MSVLRYAVVALFALLIGGIGGAFAAVTILVYVPVLPGTGIARIWDRTVGFQLGRDSPFSVWGQHPGLDTLQTLAKVALAVLSGGPPRELLAMLAAGDTARLQAVPGIGKRTAERIVVELREKVGATAPDNTIAVTRPEESEGSEI